MSLTNEDIKRVAVVAECRITTTDITVTAFSFRGTHTPDTITVFLHEVGKGKGEITIVTWGRAWSHYWSAMGDRNLSELVLQASTCYIANKLTPAGVLTNRETKKREEKYLTAIIEDVKDALLSRAATAERVAE